jgi:hypothetical protein
MGRKKISISRISDERNRKGQVSLSDQSCAPAQHVHNCSGSLELKLMVLCCQYSYFFQNIGENRRQNITFVLCCHHSDLLQLWFSEYKYISVTDHFIKIDWLYRWINIFLCDETLLSSHKESFRAVHGYFWLQVLSSEMDLAESRSINGSLLTLS